MTDFRAEGTIMGLAGLTAVFGMGTGVTPPVWSPEKCTAGGQAGPGTVAVNAVGRPHTSRWQSRFALQNPFGDHWPDRAAGRQRADRGGQAARLLGPVG